MKRVTKNCIGFATVAVLFVSATCLLLQSIPMI